jgi:hypothetical protein
LGFCVVEGTNVVVGLTNNYTSRAQVIGDHAIGNVVLDPLFEEDKQRGLYWHLVVTQVLHSMDQEEDRAYGGFLALSEAHGFVLDAILLFSEVEA